MRAIYAVLPANFSYREHCRGQVISPGATRVTRHGGGAQAEKRLEPVEVQLVQNLVRMNASRDSRSNIRTLLFRSTPCSK